MAEYSAASGTVSSSGDTVIYTPPSGKQPQMFYYCLNASGSNTAPVTVTLRFASGSPICTLSLVPGAILSRNIGAGKFCLHGVPDDTIIVNLGTAQTVNYSLEYWYV
jgi:hypothetical protein